MTKEHGLALDYTPAQSRPSHRQPPAALGKLTAAALVGIAMALTYVQVGLTGEFAPDLTIFAGLMLLAAGSIMVGWRWAPGLGALLSVVVVAGNSGAVIYDLTHPETFRLFTFMVVAVSLALVGTLAGIGAAVQNYRRGGPRTAPRWTAGALAALLALGTGATLVAALPRAAEAGVSQEVLARLPAITTPGFHFDQTELKVKAGETVALRFDNPHVAPHSFDVDELNVHVPVAAGKNSLILFKPTQPGVYTFYCQLPGHREEGMEGTLVVEP